MQVYILGSPLETAKKLDKKRLNNQINECTIMLRAIDGQSVGWFNHPCTQQYNSDKGAMYLHHYKLSLQCYMEGDLSGAEYHSEMAQAYAPKFITPEFIDQMKRRLYTKDKQHYAEFAELGESNQNWFFVDGVIRVYENGKRIK